MTDAAASNAMLVDDNHPPVVRCISAAAAAAVGCGGGCGDIRGIFGCCKAVTLTLGCQSFRAVQSERAPPPCSSRPSAPHSERRMSRPEFERPNLHHPGAE